MSTRNFLQELADRVYEVNVANGWFEDDRRFGEDVALLHSEVSEMLEEYRDHGLKELLEFKSLGKTVVVGSAEHENISDHHPGLLGKPIGVASECADVLIRLLDTCKRYDIDLLDEFERKLAYNATRGFKHGNKRL